MVLKKYRKKYYTFIVFTVLLSQLYSINPPKDGGPIPQKYLDIFKNQKITQCKDLHSHGNAFARSSYADIQSPPSNYNLAVIMIDFSDKSSSLGASDFQQHLFGNNTTGSLTDYFDEISYGQFSLTGNVYGPYTSTSTQAEALNNTSTFITSVLEEANGDIDYSNYDNDNDGIVDALMVIFPGTGADEDGEDSGHIWPHMSILWNDTQDGYYSGSFDGVTFSKYAVCPEKRRVGNSNQYLIRPIGVYAHEFGHTLGLPDLYDRSEENASEGVGEWCLMASGSWLGNDGDTPSHMSAWCKYKLGWVDPVLLIQDSLGLVLDNAAENDDDIYKIYADGYQWNEYFLLENRQLVGFDAQQNGSGLLIYHVDENQFFGMNNLFGAGINNDDYTHKLVDVEEADGDNDLDFSVNRGDSGDSYPGLSGNSSFSASSSPDNDNYSGISSSVEISSITEEQGVIALNVSIPERDGLVLSYSNGIAAAYGYSDVGDYTYAVKFTAPQNGYLNKIDVGFYADENDIDINIYRSMSSSGTMYDNIFQGSFDQIDSGWNVLDINPIYFYSGQTFYVVLTNKQLSYGYVTDYTFNEFNSNSYIYNSTIESFGQSSIGNFCIRSRFDSDGALSAPVSDGIPEDFEINKAYPNPFNPFVNLSYSVARPGDISIAIYDLKGREVELLKNAFHAPGKYRVVWDAEDLSSGIYFAEYRNSKTSIRQKLSLIK